MTESAVNHEAKDELMERTKSLFYIPVAEQIGCTLSPDTIDPDKAYAVAALYRGPRSKVSHMLRKAEVLLEQPIPRSNLDRHIKHLRPATRLLEDFRSHPDDEGYESFTKAQAIADFRQAQEEEPNNGWDYAIRYLEKTVKGDDTDVTELMDELIDDLGRWDAVRSEMAA